MTDEQFMQRLEYKRREIGVQVCIDHDLLDEIINFINCREAEMERLKMVIEQIEDDLQPLPFETNFEKAAKRIKSEAIKEFAERLKRKFGIADCIVTVDNNDIDEIIKEMMEEK